ncbi:hypothetical protein DA075_07645 [Methylobacterium currus]|uniref:3',5'-cyclic-nucleotide phosphodiesterase n=1 Tax=Methylobacterium currus TaxID=2051553 RepID=A0A2R4WGY2_9HYPH|nr:hypothetical protein [Methylobacterium currus]AWB20802.1 hypothetical protein DA075_07645 [Methylobacterium currus]UHC14404.1 hypothetical protein LRS73_17760 [Methylobacterium currus]
MSMPLTRTVALAAAVVLLGSVGRAGAQGSGQGSQQGTERQRLACMTDAMTLCASDVPNTRRIEACLRRNYASISPPCQGELDAARGAAGGSNAAPSYR